MKKEKLSKHLHAFSFLIYKASKLNSRLLIFFPFCNRKIQRRIEMFVPSVKLHHDVFPNLIRMRA